MKTYRSSPEVLAEIERALSQNRYSSRASSPLDGVVKALHEGRHYLATTIYITAADRLVLQGMSGKPGADEEIPLGEGIVGKVAETGRGRVALDVTRDSDYRKVHEETRSEIAEPVRTPSRVLGVINVESSNPYALGREDQILLKEVATRLGVFLAGPGKYLVHRWRIVEAAGGKKTLTQPRGDSGQGRASSAAAGKRTAK